MEQPNTNKNSIKVHFYLSIGLYNANQEETIEVTEDEVDLTNKEELETYLDAYVNDWANNYIEFGYEILKRNVK